MNPWKDEELESFCREADFDKDHVEVKEMASRIWDFVHEIAKFIGVEDSLFENSVIPSGSFYEDLKAEGPDEFDFMICLEDLSEPGVCEEKEIPLRPVRDPGYIDVQVVSEVRRRRWQRYISRRGNLRPDVLLQKFQQLIEKALKEIKPVAHDRLSWRSFDVVLRKIPVTMKLTWNGNNYSNYEIAVDLTLCIKMPGWPESSDVRNRVERGHPGYKAIREASRVGHHLVASTIGESGKRRPCWRLSFSAAEGILLKHICKSPKPIHKMTVKFLKVLRKKNEEDLCLLERGSVDEEDYSAFRQSYIMITWSLSSYVLKTMFLQEWLEFPQDSYWRKDKLRERVKSILKRVQNSVKQRDIRSFWVPDYKLFNFRARNATQVDRSVSKLSSLIDRLGESNEKSQPKTRRRPPENEGLERMFSLLDLDEVKLS